MKIKITLLALVILALGLSANASKYVQKVGTERVSTPGSVNVVPEVFGSTRLETFYLNSLSLNNFTNGNSANGVLLTTLPAGAQGIKISRLNISLLASNGSMVNDTPDVGIGTVKATGAVNVLSGTATFENILTGQTALNANGSTFNGTDLTVDLLTNASGVKTIYLNAADAWAGNGSVAATGEIQIQWVDLSY